MKWKNIDIGASCYYVAGTFAVARAIVCDEIGRALVECDG